MLSKLAPKSDHPTMLKYCRIFFSFIGSLTCLLASCWATQNSIVNACWEIAAAMCYGEDWTQNAVLSIGDRMASINTFRSKGMFQNWILYQMRNGFPRLYTYIYRQEALLSLLEKNHWLRYIFYFQFVGDGRGVDFCVAIPGPCKRSSLLKW